MYCVKKRQNGTGSSASHSASLSSGRKAKSMVFSRFSQGGRAVNGCTNTQRHMPRGAKRERWRNDESRTCTLLCIVPNPIVTCGFVLTFWGRIHGVVLCSHSRTVRNCMGNWAKIHRWLYEAYANGVDPCRNGGELRIFGVGVAVATHRYCLCRVDGYWRCWHSSAGHGVVWRAARYAAHSVHWAYPYGYCRAQTALASKIGRRCVGVMGKIRELCIFVHRSAAR